MCVVTIQNYAPPYSFCLTIFSITSGSMRTDRPSRTTDSSQRPISRRIVFSLTWKMDAVSLTVSRRFGGSERLSWSAVEASALGFTTARGEGAALLGGRWLTHAGSSPPQPGLSSPEGVPAPPRRGVTPESSDLEKRPRVENPAIAIANSHARVETIREPLQNRRRYLVYGFAGSLANQSRAILPTRIPSIFLGHNPEEIHVDVIHEIKSQACFRSNKTHK